LSAVKNVGENFIKTVIKARSTGLFTSFTDFVERIEKVDSSVMNKRAVESLIKCGALDSLGANRAQLLAIFEKVIDGVHSNRKRNIEGQFSIFDNVEEDIYRDMMPDLKEFPKNVILAMEKEVVGIYISGHPLEPYREQLKEISTTTTFDLINSDETVGNDFHGVKDGQKVVLGGIIVEKKNKITKNNNMMAFITIEDLYGAIEGIVFPATYDRFSKYLVEDKIVVIEGKASMSEVEDPKIIVERFSELTTFNKGKLYLKISTHSPVNTMNEIKSLLGKYKGNTPVYVYLEKDKKTIMADRSLWIDINSQRAINQLKSLLGEESVKVM